jgi:hypothetical protein
VKPRAQKRVVEDTHESPSVCADAARQGLIAQTADITPEERDRDLDQFNAELRKLIDAGRILR